MIEDWTERPNKAREYQASVQPINRQNPKTAWDEQRLVTASRIPQPSLGDAVGENRAGGSLKGPEMMRGPPCPEVIN
jgi:hypothetical protein